MSPRYRRAGIFALIVTAAGVAGFYALDFGRGSSSPDDAASLHERSTRPPASAAPARSLGADTPLEAAPADAIRAAGALPRQRVGFVLARVIRAETREPLAFQPVFLASPLESRNGYWSYPALPTAVESRIIARGSTDADGRVAFEGVPLARCVIRVDDEFSSPITYARIAPSPTLPDEPETLAVVRGGKVTGTVRSADGAPIAGAEVRLLSEGRDWLDYAAAMRDRVLDSMPAGDDAAAVIIPSVIHDLNDRVAVTDAAGRFSFTGVPPCRLFAAAVREGFACGRTDKIGVSGDSVHELPPISLDAGGSLSVRLAAPDSGSLGNVDVFLRGDLAYEGWPTGMIPDRRNGTPDAAGLVRFAHLRPGLYDVHARGAAFGRSKIEGIVVRQGEETRATLAIDFGHAVAARVVDESGHPIARASVRAEGPIDSTTTDESGTFRLGGFDAAEPVIVEVAADDYLPSEPLDLVAGEPPETVVLRRGAGISGRVEDSRGEPVVEYVMTVEPAGLSEDERFHSADSETREVRDPSGAFSVSGLRERTYVFRVDATASGLGFAEFGPFTLEDGQRREDWLVRLAPMITVRGSVVAAGSRRPIGGAAVGWTFDAEDSSSSEDDFFGILAAPHASRTRSDGTFAISVPAGARAIRVAHPRHLALRVEPVPSAGEDGTVRLELALPSGGSVSGVALGADGAPAVGAVVGLLRVDGSGVATVKVGPGGRYLISPVAAGAYFVRLSAPTGAEGRDLFGRTVPVSLFEGESLTVDLGGPVPGQARISGTLTRDGEPVAGRSVRLLAAFEDSEALFSGRTAWSDERGRFEFDGVPLGGYVVRAFVDGVEMERGAVVSGDARDVACDLEWSGSGGGALIVTVVSDRDGRPLKARVVARPIDANGDAREPGRARVVHSGDTNDDGLVELRGLPRGPLRVIAEPWDGIRRVALHASVAADWIVASDASNSAIELRARLGTTLEGLVADPDGRPVRLARVSILDEHGEFVPGVESVASGLDGRYRVRNVPPGTHAVRVSAPGFAASVQPAVLVEAGAASSRADFTLHRGGSVELRVTDANGNAIPGATARVERVPGDSIDDGALAWRVPALLVTDATGSCRGENVAEGRQRVRVAAGNRSGEVTIDVVDGRSVEAVVVVR